MTALIGGTHFDIKLQNFMKFIGNRIVLIIVTILNIGIIN